MKLMITKKGGVHAYIGTTSITQIEERIVNGDEKAKFIMDAMGYQLGAHRCVWL